MVYNFNGKNITISDEEINHNMTALGISKQESIELWLDDNGYTECAEVAELTAKASENDTLLHENSGKRKNKPRTVKISDEKAQIFDDLTTFLAKNYDISVIKDNKLIEISLNGKKFKLDLIEQRAKKTS